MIYFQRAGVALPGKQREAHDYVVRRQKYLKDAHGVDAKIAIQVGGPVGHIALSSSHDSMADIEALRRKIMEDPASAALQAEAADLFVPGETRDTLWMTA